MGFRVFRTTYKDRRGRTREVKKWYIEFRDHLERVRRLPAFESKSGSEELGRNLVKLVAYHKGSGGQTDPALMGWLGSLPRRTREKLVSIGLLDRERAAVGKLLADHLADWKQALTDRNNSLKHVRISHQRVCTLLEGCKCRTLADVQASRVENWLAQERRAGRLSIRTSNYYLRDSKSFFRWLVNDGRATFNPLQSLKPLNAEVEDHRERRCLPELDFQAFLHAAGNGKALGRLSGTDRFILYVLAGNTGLRAQELASLTPESFHLDGDAPFVVVEAGYSKHKREDVQPLREDLSEMLRDWLRDRPAGERLWPGSWWNKAAKLVQVDLKAARAAWMAETTDPAQLQRREESDRFAYRDADGRYFDFHSLRGQFISTMQNAGVSLKTLQRLARHSRVETTLRHYARVELADVRSALDALPRLTGSRAESDVEATRATGTEGAGVLASCLALSERFQEAGIDSGRRTAARAAKGESHEKPLISGVFAGFSGGCEEKAPPGFEPGMADLQSAALPLG